MSVISNFVTTTNAVTPSTPTLHVKSRIMSRVSVSEAGSVERKT